MMMGLQKLQETIATINEVEMEPSETKPRLMLVRPDEIDLDEALLELAEIIEAEGGILIP